MLNDIIFAPYINEFELINDRALLCLGNSLEKLKLLKDNSIDCIITDPPYFIDGMGNDWNLDKLKSKIKKSGVIGSLPSGMKFDVKQGKELQDFMFRISTEVYRILKPGGFYLSFSQGRLYHRMAVAIEDCGFEIRDMYIWKREGQGKAFSQDHFIKKMGITEAEKDELIESIGNRKTPQLKTQSEPIILAQKPREGTFVENWKKYKVGLIDVSQSLDGKFPGTVMEVKKPKGRERKFSHMTAKPTGLIEHLVKIFTIENAIVLDMFMGSGTTGEACINTNRRFVGIELVNEYYTMSKCRIENI